MKRRCHLRYVAVDGSVMLERILRKQGVKVWTGFSSTQDKDQWRALADTVINFQFL
jgi:hypothetical protein